MRTRMMSGENGRTAFYRGAVALICVIDATDLTMVETFDSEGNSSQIPKWQDQIDQILETKLFYTICIVNKCDLKEKNIENNNDDDDDDDEIEEKIINLEKVKYIYISH